MSDSLVPAAQVLHDGARVLILDWLQTLTPAERVRIETMDGSLRAEILLRIGEAAITFTHETSDGRREELGCIALPLPAHETDCPCV